MSLFEKFIFSRETPRCREGKSPRVHGVVTATRGSVLYRIFGPLTDKRRAEMQKNGADGIRMMQKEVEEEERQRNNS